MDDTQRIQVGDLVVMQHASYYEEFNGCIGLVVGELRPRHSTDLRTMEKATVHAYAVQLTAGFVVNAMPYQLRRLRDSEDPEHQEILEDAPEEVEA